MSGYLSTYMGPVVQITPDELPRYEKEGCWVADEKKDGAWCELRTNEEGVIFSLLSRRGKAFKPNETEGLLGLQIPLPNTTLIGELEVKSNAATERFKAIGFRRIHLFDVVRLQGNPRVVEMDVLQRRELVGLAQQRVGRDPSIGKRILLVRQEPKNFGGLYQDVRADNDEGLVLKRVNSLYEGGKSEQWVRCKAYRHIEYVVTSIGASPTGAPNLQVGLFFGSKLKRVCTIKTPPADLDLASLVGKVVECKGAEVFPSGALRHGHFEKIRDDKVPNECTIQAARAIGDAA